MRKYKLSPEERAAEKERKENLRNVMKGLDVKSFDDLKDVFKLMVGEMLKMVLKANLMMNSVIPSTITETNQAKTAVTVILKRL